MEAEKAAIKSKAIALRWRTLAPLALADARLRAVLAKKKDESLKVTEDTMALKLQLEEEKKLLVKAAEEKARKKKLENKIMN